MKSTVLSTAQLLVVYGAITLAVVESKLADRSRVVKARHDSGRSDRFHDNGRPIEGQSYRSVKIEENSMRVMDKEERAQRPRFQAQEKKTTSYKNGSYSTKSSLGAGFSSTRYGDFRGKSSPQNEGRCSYVCQRQSWKEQ